MLQGKFNIVFFTRLQGFSLLKYSHVYMFFRDAMEVSRIRKMINKNEWNIERKLGAESKNIFKVSGMKNSKA